MLEEVFRDEWGRVLASLVGFLGDFDKAEDAAQEAFAIAAERWPAAGVPLAVEVNGFSPDPFGGQRAGFSATAQINRRDLGIGSIIPMDGGGVVVGDKVSISLEIEAVLQK